MIAILACIYTPMETQSPYFLVVGYHEQWLIEHVNTEQINARVFAKTAQEEKGGQGIGSEQANEGGVQASWN